MQIADEEISFHADEVREQLRRACDESGSVSAWARANAMSVAAVHDALSGRNGISAELAKKLGFKKVDRYLVEDR